ncbi:MAG TPA: hypothetical protein VFL46_05750 [Phycicoccus sp.]|nr:hypothetical protein [Phycicoccus sp.]
MQQSLGTTHDVPAGAHASGRYVLMTDELREAPDPYRGRHVRPRRTPPFADAAVAVTHIRS